MELIFNKLKSKNSDILYICQDNRIPDFNNQDVDKALVVNSSGTDLIWKTIQSGGSYTQGDGISISSNVISLNKNYTATTSRNGLMSSDDKIKIDNLPIVTNPSSIVILDSTGKIPTSCYINTTYDLATTSTSGLISSDDKQKLNTLPLSSTLKDNINKFLKVNSDGTGYIFGQASTGGITYDSGVGINIDNTNHIVNLLTSYTATTSRNGLMSSSDKSKLTNIEANAQKNIIEEIKLSGWSDSLTPTNKIITIPYVNTNYSGLMSSDDKIKLNRFPDDLTDNALKYLRLKSDETGYQLVSIPSGSSTTYNSGSGIIVKELDKTINLNHNYTATTDRNGLMSSDDKIKIDNLPIVTNPSSIVVLDSTGKIPTSCYINTTYDLATTSTSGLMSSDDKSKIDTYLTTFNSAEKLVKLNSSSLIDNIYYDSIVTLQSSTITTSPITFEPNKHYKIILGANNITLSASTLDLNKMGYSDLLINPMNYGVTCDETTIKFANGSVNSLTPNVLNYCTLNWINGMCLIYVIDTL